MQAVDLSELDSLSGESLGHDSNVIFDILKKQGRPVTDALPDVLKKNPKLATAIEGVCGTPASNFFGALLAYAAGFGPFVLGAVIARELTSITQFQRMMLAAAPTALGGVLRFWAAQKADEGESKAAVLKLLTASVVGLLGVCAVIKHTEVKDIQADDLSFWALMLSNGLSGAGIATFSIAMADLAASAPNDTLGESHARIQRLTGEVPRTTCMSHFLRKGAADWMGMVAGIGGLTPVFEIEGATYAVSTIGLGETYALAAATTLAGQVALYFFWHNLIFDQLRAQGLATPTASKIAAWMGQTKQANPHVTFFEKTASLSTSELRAMLILGFLYIPFGLLMAFTSTGTLMFEQRGERKEMAAALVAGVSAISTMTRSAMAMPEKWPVRAATLTNVSLVVMALSLFLFATLEDRKDWLMCLPVFAVSNGVSLYSVFKQIAEDVPNKVSLVGGFAGGLGACFAILMSFGFAGLVSTNEVTGYSASGMEQMKTAKEYFLGVGVCAALLLLNIYYGCKKEKNNILDVSVSEHSRLNVWARGDRPQYTSLAEVSGGESELPEGVRHTTVLV